MFMSTVEIESGLQMMIAFSSVFSSFIVERVGDKIGLSCLFALLFVAFLSIAYERLVLYYKCVFSNLCSLLTPYFEVA